MERTSPLSRLFSLLDLCCSHAPRSHRDGYFRFLTRRLQFQFKLWPKTTAVLGQL